MERLADMFGWNIKEGSLYEKEFNVLRDFFEETKTGEETTTTAQTATQLEFNFDEPVTEAKIGQEEEVKPEQTEDTMDFEDDDLFRSSIQENESKFSSVPTFIDTLPLNQQSEVIDKINKGEIQTSCR